MPIQADYAGDVDHPDHEKYLIALGKAFYATTELAGICFDVLRVHAGWVEADLYNDPLSRSRDKLVSRVADMQHLEGYQEFSRLVEQLVDKRNDLIHSLPVKSGLHRRSTRGGDRIVNFYTIQDLESFTEECRAAVRLGNKVLYADGGEGIRKFYQ